MKYVVADNITLSQELEGPLSDYICSFARSLREQGYCLYSIHRHVLLAACFSRWLKQKGVGLRGITSDHPGRYLRYRARHSRPWSGDAGALSNLLDFLCRNKVIPAKGPPEPRLTQAERWTRAYEHYLREARGLTEATILNYVPFIRKFLRDCFGDGAVKLSRLRCGDVVRFVRRQTLHLRRSRAQLLTSALRSFLRYARGRGYVTLDLAVAVPSVANQALSSIPRAIAPDQIRRLLASIDRRTATGRRDHAILLLLARLGLRAGEVAFLELDDINWNAGQLSIRGKGGRRSPLPLPADVGKAIVVYLQRGRPEGTSRRVFLRAKAPIRGFRGPSSVSSIVRHCLQRAAIVAPTNGAHQFRHGLATEMLRQGASLSEIGELLRHRSPETTKIYAKVNIDALRSLALPWPGDVR
jgi:integrase/recombinase XerD